MLYYLLLPFSLVNDFINQGGVVLLVLFFVASYMWNVTLKCGLKKN